MPFFGLFFNAPLITPCHLQASLRVRSYSAILCGDDDRLARGRASKVLVNVVHVGGLKWQEHSFAILCSPSFGFWICVCPRRRNCSAQSAVTEKGPANWSSSLRSIRRNPPAHPPSIWPPKTNKKNNKKKRTLAHCPLCHEEELFTDLRALMSKNANSIAQALQDVIASIADILFPGEERPLSFFFSPKENGSRGGWEVPNSPLLKAVHFVSWLAILRSWYRAQEPVKPRATTKYEKTRKPPTPGRSPKLHNAKYRTNTNTIIFGPLCFCFLVFLVISSSFRGPMRGPCLRGFCVGVSYYRT